ncbi:MAG TPA: type 1 glutamine amidotransferase domain-containing protein [Polyangium sp.]|nr:type 1 glutamine amidotransferase domain-containing protein [Polyangium sp.]
MRGIVTRGLWTGAALTAATATAMMSSSTIERGSPWAGLNAMATAAMPTRRVGLRFQGDVTPLGFLLLTGGLLGWGLAYQGVLARARPERPGGVLLASALSALGGYAFDALVMPERLVPNFRRAMGTAGTLAKYLALGVASYFAARPVRHRRLAGRKIAVLTADGFEQVELFTPARAIGAEGGLVEVLSLRPGKIVGMNVDVPGRRVRVQRTIREADPAEYDALFVPGGFIAPDFLRQSQEVREFVRAFDAAGKPIGAICHGAWVLASAGILRGRHITSWPGIRDDLVNAGATWRDEAVVRDGNIISSRGPQDLPVFTSALVDFFTGSKPTPERPWAPAASSPQRSAPPAMALAGAAHLPKVAKARSVLGLTAAFAVGLAALPALRAFTAFMRRRW